MLWSMSRYAVQSFNNMKMDIKIFEIRKEFHELPWTVIIFNHSKVGDRQLFSDLFSTQSWDKYRGEDGVVSDDVRFCINYWNELGMVEKYGPFVPECIQFDEDRMPAVYRSTADKVLMQKFGAGHKFEIDGMVVDNFIVQ